MFFSVMISELVTGHEHEIRLDDVVKGEHDVERREKDSADAGASGEEISDREVQPPTRSWWRRPGAGVT